MCYRAYSIPKESGQTWIQIKTLKITSIKIIIHSNIYIDLTGMPFVVQKNIEWGR
jgi:hypothetical protein